METTELLLANLAAQAIAKAKEAAARAMTPGPQGERGEAGPQGLPGEQGPQGLQGERGLTGDTGPQGLQGAPGEVGPAGRDGVDGLPGLPGAAGPTGRDGRDGLPGEQGPQGIAGARGAEGAQGPKGEKGDKPDHEWVGSQLRFEKPDGTWGPLVELRGPKGARGTQGASGGGGGGGSVTTAPKTRLYDQVSNTTAYVGEAAPGTAEGAPGWQVRRVTFSPGGDVSAVEYAALGAFTSVWSDRAGLSYS